MSRRKCELTYRQVDRLYPYQVALPAEQTRRRAYDEALDFCKSLSLAPRSLGVFHDGVEYNIWAFADPSHAEAFKARFGGIDFNPADRGKGRNSHLWNRQSPVAQS